MFLKSFQCLAADDDVDGDPDHHDGGDAGDAIMSTLMLMLAMMGVERRASGRARVAWLYCESVEANERVVRMRGAMW